MRRGGQSPAGGLQLCECPGRAGGAGTPFLWCVAKPKTAL